MSYLTEEIDKAIQGNDRKSILATLTNVCLRDPTFSSNSFQDALCHAEKNYTVLYEEFREGEHPLYGARVDIGDETLQKNDFGDSLVHLEQNFCEKRIADTKKLGRFLYPVKSQLAKEKSKSSKNSEVTQLDLPKKSILPLLFLCAGLIGILLILKKLLG